MNEGFLGKHTLSGERAATGDHPVVLHHLPLSASAKAAVIPVGTVMKRVDVMGDEGESHTVVGAAWEPLLSTDEIRRIVALFRYCNPEAYIRIAAGRIRFGDGGLALFTSGANATLTGDMLTTTGNHTMQDRMLLAGLGYALKEKAV